MKQILFAILVLSYSVSYGQNISLFGPAYPKIFNVQRYGANGNAKDVIDAGMSSNTTVTSASAAFTTSDVGKACIMYGSGSAGINQVGTINAFISSTQVTVSFTAAATVSSKEFFYGTDCTAGIQAAINAADANLGGKVFFPSGVYFIGGALVTSQNTSNPNCQIYIPFHAFSGQFEYSIEIEGESAVNAPSGYFGTPNPTPTTGVVLRSILTGTGSQPCIIGGGDPTHQVATSLFLKTFNVQAYTNGGTVAPTMSALWLHNIYKSSGYRVSASLDVPNQNSNDPSGTQTVGIGSGFISEAGPNNWTECAAMGFKYGFLLGEHTELMNTHVFSCQFAYVIPSSFFSVTGFALYHACNNGVYFPNSTVMGIVSGPSRIFDLKFEAEIDSSSFFGGHWYNTFISNISDSGNNGSGIIQTLNLLGNSVPTTPPAGIVMINGSNITSLTYNSFGSSISPTISTVLTNGNTGGSGQKLILTGSSTTASNLGIAGLGLQSYSADNGFLHSNMVYNSGYKYVTSAAGEAINLGSGAMYFNCFPSGTAGGSPASITTPLYLDNTGIVKIGAAPGATVYNMIVSPTKVKVNPGLLQTGTSSDSVLVWHAADSAAYLVAQSSLGGGGGSQTLDQTLTLGNSSAQTISLTGSKTTADNLVIGGMGIQSYAADNLFIHSNMVYNSGYKYVTSTTGEAINLGGGAIYFNCFPSGTAGGSPSSTTTPLYLDNTGIVKIGAGPGALVYNMIVNPASITLNTNVISTGTTTDSLLAITTLAGVATIKKVSQPTLAVVTTAGNSTTNDITVGNITSGVAGKGLFITEGTNGRVGQTTLVSGTKAITISGLTTSSRAFVQLVSPSGTTLTTSYQAVCTSNTLVIQANVAAGTINTADGSLCNYFIIN